MKVFYHVDNDGKCAAYWVKHFLNIKLELPCEIYQIQNL